MPKLETDRRRSQRIAHRMVARFEASGKREVGAVWNFSEVGLFLQSHNLLPVGSPISLGIGSGQTMTLEGTVIWNRPEPPIPDGASPAGMGIALTASPPEYLELVQKLREHLKNAPRGIEERFEAYHRVRFQSGGAFFTEYTENLSRGGMYLATQQNLQSGQEITASLEIPGLEDPIQLRCKVAFCLTPAQAEERGRAAGVGIQFVELGAAARAHLHHYLKRLEVHRSQPERRMVGSLPTTGSLTEFLLPEILLSLLSQQATGVLQLQRGEVSKSIYLRKGHPVYVESTLRSDRLGHFLFRRGKLNAKEFEESIRELTESNMRLGEILIKRNLIDQSTLAEALVDHQEDMISSAFPWFDGHFEFTPGLGGVTTISPFPLRIYRVIFDGIHRWYDAPVIRAWMGLHEKSLLRQTSVPALEVGIPPTAVRTLRHLTTPQSVEDLAGRLKLPIEQLLPTAYALVICGWVELHFGEAKATKVTEKKAVAEPKPVGPKMSAEALTTLRKRIDEDFERFRNLDFYELLKVKQGASDVELKTSFLDLSSRYSNVDTEQIDDVAIRDKTERLKSWIHLAYETLSDPSLRQLYARQGAKKGKGNVRTTRLDAEKHLFAGIRALEKGKFREASLDFNAAKKISEGDKWIGGYLGWALFKDNAQENLRRAIELLDDALWNEVSDPQLYYFRGEVAGYLGNWSAAERLFAKAVKLQPNFIKAAAAFEKARDERIAQERLTRPRR